MRLHDMLEFHANDQPDAVALRDGTRSMTYGELDAQAEAVADALTAAGLGKGDRFGVLAANCLEFFSCYLGGAKIGAVTVPLNQRLAPPEQDVTRVAPDLGIDVLLHEGHQLLDVEADRSPASAEVDPAVDQRLHVHQPPDHGGGRPDQVEDVTLQRPRQLRR